MLTFTVIMPGVQPLTVTRPDNDGTWLGIRSLIDLGFTVTDISTV